MDDETLEQVKSWYTEKHDAQYNLPATQPPEFKEDEFNCATFPDKLGVTIPIMTGHLRLYVEMMKLKGAKPWTPSKLDL